MTAERRLPNAVFALILIATGLLWLIVILAVLAFALSPYRIDPLSVLPNAGDAALQVAIGLQMGGTVLALAVALIMGTLITISYLSAAHTQAIKMALLLVRISIGLSVLQFLTGMATPYAISGFSGALPVLVPGLPLMLVQIALLLCAARYLSRPAESVF